MRHRALLVALAALHFAVSARALWDHGYLALYRFAFQDWPQFQIFVDLFVAVMIANVFLVRDARATGRTAWPWLVATVFVGSLAPLTYFLVGAFAARPDRSAPDGTVPAKP